jgi:hypothetical protein
MRIGAKGGHRARIVGRAERLAVAHRNLQRMEKRIHVGMHEVGAVGVPHQAGIRDADRAPVLHDVRDHRDRGRLGERVPVVRMNEQPAEARREAGELCRRV